MTPNDFTLTREEASERLGVSVRTVDRYIRRHVFEVQRSGRQVWISQTSFENYLKNLPFEPAATGTPSASPLKARHLLPQTVSESDVSEAIAVPGRPETLAAERSAPTRPTATFTAHAHDYDHPLSPTYIYKTLYEELKEKHDEQVKRLEGAHYRVGQLEAQVKSMVPEMEYKKQQKQLLLMGEQLKTTVEEAQHKLLEAKKRVHTERLNKNVYISLVYSLLAMHIVFWALLR